MQLFSLPVFQLAGHNSTCSILPEVHEADDAKTMKRMLYLDFFFLKGSLVVSEEIDSSITFQKLFEIYASFF